MNMSEIQISGHKAKMKKRKKNPVHSLAAVAFHAAGRKKTVSISAVFDIK